MPSSTVVARLAQLQQQHHASIYVIVHFMILAPMDALEIIQREDVARNNTAQANNEARIELESCLRETDELEAMSNCGNFEPLCYNRVALMGEIRMDMLA
ncbi:hypothetical protein M8C21_005657 [Ambrosia artemisiifolia]|uniref:Uncharacterized protein n=1 Tax=Ambrosia artemisiifolia TaxID=4212 RepID=A0AAD5CJ61_AMBAR|nr:hypothetical protein M8C21_005657 [Ambrosia artemisiifolia]